MFVVVNPKTWHTLDYKAFDTLGAARRSATCANKRVLARMERDRAKAKKNGLKFNKNSDTYPTYVAMSEEAHEEGHTLVETRNLMKPGKPVMIRKSQLGGCCDPGTERYWSM